MGYRRTMRLFFILLLCTALVTVEVFPFPQETERLRVALLGVRFKNVKPAEQERVMNDLVNLLRLEPSLEVLDAAAVEQHLGREGAESLMTSRSKEGLAEAARQLAVEHIFLGEIVNESSEPTRTLLAGQYYRYDRATGNLFSLEILSYSESFHEELAKIRRHFVLTIIPKEQNILLSWPVLLLFGITVIGFMALILSPGKTSLEGTNNPPPTEN